MNTVDAKRVLETALICAPQPVTLRELRSLFDDVLGSDTLKDLLLDLQKDWAHKGVELVQVAPGGASRAGPRCGCTWTSCTLKSRHATPVRPWRRWPSSPTVSR